MAAEQNALAAARPFAELLREHRLAAGIGQEALAERARLSVETVSALERGVRQRPYRETIALLAQALGLSDEDRAGLERAAKRNSVRTLAAIEPADNNLPVQLSSFVGRDRDVANVEELLAAHRLITLVGAGGVGKTRLALAVCEQLPGRHDSVWFVDFSSYADVATIPTAIASGVGLSNVSQLDRLIAYLRPKNALLVLDNCEHLIEGVAQTVTALLRSSPDLQVMATSRQALAIAGERVYRVPPLSFLGIECDPPTVGEAMKYGAIELFVERAKGADSRFELSERNVGPVAEIVRRLDGIALAIELAAARTNVFSPSSIARRIEEHVLSLTGGSRAPLPRQKTMHSVLEWSYNLLDAHERRFFQRLSVFAGSFSLELATVTLPAGDDSPAVVDVLASLVDKSLVQNEPLRDVVRYRLLEPIRQYAREKLREEGEEWEAARAHAVALLTLAERYDGPPEITPDSVWYTQLEPERENYRAAFDWALSSAGDARIAQRLAGSRTATSFGAGEAL
ncbi:MAG TPA: helix-turn-helix domain-containing protein, partial [Candidatus Cybelea sp.]